ncbi:MAG: divalent-cation tolerance protein CutA [Candidatus Saliniplasma sp.]
MMTYIFVTTTFSDKVEAEKVGKAVVNNQLGACFQIIGPMESIYSWDGKIEISEEYICFIKTKKELFEELEELIKKLHSYDTPEIIALDVKTGSHDYLDWIDKVTG